MKGLAQTLLCVLLLMPACLAQAKDAGLDAEEPSAAVALSSQVEWEEVKLGQPFWWTLRLPAEVAELYRLPEKIPLGDFVELDRRRRKESVDGKELVLLELRLANYAKLGELDLPVFSLAPVMLDGGKTDAEPLLVPPGRIRITSLLAGVDKPEPRDIQGPVPVFEDDFRLLVLAGLLLAFLLASLLVRRAPGLRSGALQVVELPPPRKAHEIAMGRLRAIVQADLLRHGEIQAYFVRINETLREYLGNRYGFFALDLTSRGLSEELRDRITPGLDIKLLRHLLHDADMVKFARWRPDDTACSTAIDGTHSIVTATQLGKDQDEDVPSEDDEVRP